MERTILHCDCNSFFASVESVLNPALKKVPMAVCGNPENRHGIILAKNELAKKYDIQTAETVWQAKRKCPKLVLVPPHHGEYEKYSAAVNEIYQRFTDLVEPFGIDESWLDVTGSMHLFGNGEQIANLIRQTVKAETGLTVSVGVSFNKIFAKLGSDYKKPDATTVISRQNFKEILFPLPASAMLFVGNSVQKSLSKLYIRTIGDLANSDRKSISAALGKTGEMIYDYANGLDDSPVRSAYGDKEIKSVGNGMTFKRNLVNQDDIRLGVTVLADTVAARMRKYGVKCTTVQVAIKDTELKVITRQKAVETPTYISGELAKAALELIKSSWNMKKPIRMITITAANLIPESEAVEQLSLFEDSGAADRDKQEHLETAVDTIRDKFGKDSILRGAVIGNDLGIHGS